MPRRVGYKATRKRARSKSKTRSSKRRRSSSKPRRTTRGRTKNVTGRSMVRFTTRRPSRSRSVRRATKLPRDARPSQAKPRSTNPTGVPTTVTVYKPQTEAEIMKMYRKKLSTKQLAVKRTQQVKQMYKTAKERKNKIAKAIEVTAHGVGKVAGVVEPLALGFSKWQPELAEYSLPVAGAAAAVKNRAAVIEKTAKAAQGDKDAYKQLTDTYKLRKVMGTGGSPNVNLITMGDASQGEADRRAIPYAPYPASFTVGTRPTVHRIEEID